MLAAGYHCGVHTVSHSGTWPRGVLFALGVLWTLPNTVLGLLLGLPALALGARVRIGDAAIVFVDYPWGPGGALTLGNTILCRRSDLDGRCVSYAERAGMCAPGGATMRLGDHERAHVYQYLVLGPLFLPLYLLCGGVRARNRFERAADRYGIDGRGWWPWSTVD